MNAWTFLAQTFTTSSQPRLRDPKAAIELAECRRRRDQTSDVAAL